MKKKNKIGRFILLTIILLSVIAFAVVQSGMRIKFIDNYVYNFKINLLGVSKYLGVELSQPVMDFLLDLPEVENEEKEIENAPSQDEENTEEVKDKDKKEESDEKIKFEKIENDNKKIKSKPIALDGGASNKYAVYNGYLLCVNSTSISAFDKNSNHMWTIPIHINDPILSVAGDYYMVAERSGLKYSLFNAKKMIYQSEADGNIKTATVSSNGDVVITSEKEFYKGAVVVTNKNGERIFSWNSGNYFLLDADISPGDRTLAVSMLDTDSNVTSVIYYFNITDGDKKGEARFDNSIAFDIAYLGDKLNVFCDNKVCQVSNKGKVAWQQDYEQRSLIRYTYESNAYKLLVLNNNDAYEFELLNKRGRVKSLIPLENIPSFLDIHKDYMAYSTNHDLILSKINGNNKKVYSAPKEIFGINIIDKDHVVIVYDSGLDFLKFS